MKSHRPNCFCFHLSLGPYRYIPGLYRVLPAVLVCHSQRVLTVCIPPPLICIAAPKYILPLRNMLSRRHAHVRKPSLYSKIWAPPHERVHNGFLTAFYRPHNRFSLCATACTHPAKSFEHAQNFRRVSPAANGPPTCSPISQCPAMCHHRVPPSARNLSHGGIR